MAASWPYTTILRSRSRVRSTSLSDEETALGGILAILATTPSTSDTPTVLRRFEGGSSFCDAPASSITSIALSGR